ncbi:rRNA methyltransferase [Candidatus Chazhemtobacterium aquaticus]|uniref:rRNA methyltransferase n=2 Tax=Candidatus Chazhemtobacterium aquaticus TaxID=2715735 RepID=A0A857N8Q5_9BACT|nr:rRNA methyltransferase [Candidatus Chazhemtobacterium aquaticus]
MVLIVLGVFLSGCQIGGVPSVEKVKEESGVPTQQSVVDIEAVGEIDVAVTDEIAVPVRVSAGQDVLFVNSSEEVVRLTYMLDREITMDLGPGGKFNFVYPGGFAEVEFMWGDGGVVLQRRDVEE